MAISKNSFMRSIKKGVKDVGTVFNPVSAAKTISKSYNKAADKQLKQENRLNKESVDNLRSPKKMFNAYKGAAKSKINLELQKRRNKKKLSPFGKKLDLPYRKDKKILRGPFLVNKKK